MTVYQLEMRIIAPQKDAGPTTLVGRGGMEVEGKELESTSLLLRTRAGAMLSALLSDACLLLTDKLHAPSAVESITTREQFAKLVGHAIHQGWMIRTWHTDTERHIELIFPKERK